LIAALIAEDLATTFYCNFLAGKLAEGPAVSVELKNKNYIRD